MIHTKYGDKLVRNLHIALEEQEYQTLLKRKGDLTWHEFIMGIDRK